MEEQQPELRLSLLPRANLFLFVLYLQGQSGGQDSIIALKIMWQVQDNKYSAVLLSLSARPYQIPWWEIL